MSSDSRLRGGVPALQQKSGIRVGYEAEADSRPEPKYADVG